MSCDELSSGDRPAPQDPAAVFRILTGCRDLEEAIAELYRALASQHRAHGEMYRLWAKTAREEESHARQFEMALARQDKIRCLKLDEATAASLLGLVREAKQRVDSERVGHVDALRMAIDIEVSLADYHVASMAFFIDEGSQKLFKAMLAADRGHIESLERQLKKLTAILVG